MKTKLTLNITHPELCKEWDYAKNTIKPDEITYGHNKKVWWACQICNESYDQYINNRITKHCGCPYCSGRRVNAINNFQIKYPEIAATWHPTKNNNMLPTSVTPGSNKKFWFICQNCKFDIFRSVKNAVRNPKHCEYCYRGTIQKNNSSINRPKYQKCEYNKSIAKQFPELINEWDIEDNIGYNPKEISIGSDIMIWWKCIKCKSKYQSRINHRCSGFDCPYCAGKKVNETNSLYSRYPDLCNYWSNTNIIKPTEVPVNSSKKVWWICPECKEEVKVNIHARVRSYLSGHNSCTFCANRTVNDKNNLVAIFPGIIKIWDYDKNYPLLPENMTKSSRKRIWWKCNECGYSYQTTINSKLESKNCMLCSNRVSLFETLWLDSLKIPNDNRHRSVHITINKKRFILDGFDSITNTIYEFYGDFWHGNPKIFDSNDINYVNNKTFGELYDNTIKRENILKNEGCKIISIWEYEWKQLMKENNKNARK